MRQYREWKMFLAPGRPKSLVQSKASKMETSKVSVQIETSKLGPRPRAETYVRSTALGGLYPPRLDLGRPHLSGSRSKMWGHLLQSRLLLVTSKPMVGPPSRLQCIRVAGVNGRTQVRRQFWLRSRSTHTMA